MVFHLDFVAKIRLKQGGSKNVLIELQKSNLAYDILRFRRYLGKKYLQADEVLLPDGTVAQEALPIITIYFLEFNIDGNLPNDVMLRTDFADIIIESLVKWTLLKRLYIKIIKRNFIKSSLGNSNPTKN